MPARKLDVRDILRIQCNGYPVLFLDSVLVVDPMRYVIGSKNFTFNEWFFPAHFPGNPLVPGFVLVEAMAQTFIMTFLADSRYEGQETNLVQVNSSRFRLPLRPGDTLVSHAHLHSFRRGIATGQVESFVGRELACGAEFVVSVPQVLDEYRPRPPSPSEAKP